MAYQLGSNATVLTMLPWIVAALAGLAILTLVAVILRRPRTRVVAMSLMAGSVLVAVALAAAPVLLGMTWHVVSV
ncbi:hypothetical protein [Salana multivorans]